MVKRLKRPIIHSKYSSVEGSKVAIIVGVHGNEKGPQFEWEWLNYLEITRGTLYLIFANPSASELGVRFVNINLNRRFGNNIEEFPEDRIAREIEEVLDKCDASLDLHMYNETMDRPFIICSPRSNEVAKSLPAEFVVNIPNGVNDRGTDDYMKMNGKIGICFETGSVERPEDYSETTRQAVLAFLSKFDMIEGQFNHQKNQKILQNKALKWLRVVI